MKHLVISCLALAIMSVGVTRLQAQPSFRETRLDLYTEAQVDPFGWQWQDNNAWYTGYYHDASLNCAMPASSSEGSVTAFTSASMTWESASKGNVSFTDTGFLWAMFGGSGAADLDQTFWSYTFTAGNDKAFKLKYSAGVATSSVDEPFVYGFSLLVYQGGELIFAEDMDVGTAGHLKVRLSPGETYTAVIQPNADLSISDGYGLCTMWGNFDWEIK
jgi:hypothetical protein